MQEENKTYNPLVSVIIPCYNGGKYLAETLDSVSMQSYTNWECIVADDGSTDNSKTITESYIQKESRFKYVYHVNAGPSAARNLGIKASKGEYLLFLDSDDLIEKDKLKRQVEVFREFPSTDLVYGDMKYFTKTPDGKISLKENTDIYWKNGRISGKGDEIIPVLLKGNIMVVDSPLIKRTVFDKIGLWDTEIWFNEDWDVWTRCAISGLSFQFDDAENTDTLVRDHEDSRSRDIFKMFTHGLKVCLKIDEVVITRKYKNIIRPRIYFHQHFLDKGLLAKHAADKSQALTMATNLYRETNLVHYLLFAWLVQNAPFFCCKVFSRTTYLFNRVKCKILYEA